MASTLYALQYVISADIDKLYAFTLKEDVSKEFEFIVDYCVRKVLEQPLKSAKMLDLVMEP